MSCWVLGSGQVVVNVCCVTVPGAKSDCNRVLAGVDSHNYHTGQSGPVLGKTLRGDQPWDAQRAPQIFPVLHSRQLLSLCISSSLLGAPSSQNVPFSDTGISWLRRMLAWCPLSSQDTLGNCGVAFRFWDPSSRCGMRCVACAACIVISGSFFLEY